MSIECWPDLLLVLAASDKSALSLSIGRGVCSETRRTVARGVIVQSVYTTRLRGERTRVCVCVCVGGCPFRRLLQLKVSLD